MTQVTYSDMTDEQLVEQYDRLGRSYMYYQAAEGNWSRETKDRLECEREYFACQKEIMARGIEIH
jgi:hypothetical protein